MKRLLQPEFYGDLVYRFRNIVGKSNISELFRKLNNRYKNIGYSLAIMRQTACLVVNPIIVDGYASLFNWTTAVRASDSMTASSMTRIQLSHRGRPFGEERADLCSFLGFVCSSSCYQGLAATCDCCTHFLDFTFYIYTDTRAKRQTKRERDRERDGERDII